MIDPGWGVPRDSGSVYKAPCLASSLFVDVAVTKMSRVSLPYCLFQPHLPSGSRHCPWSQGC